MPIARFKFPDGRIGRFEVPEGTTPEQAQSMIEAHVYSSHQEETAPSIDPTEGMSTGQKMLAGAGKAVVDTGRGAGQLLRHAMPDSWADNIGLPTQAEIDQAKELDAPLMQTGAGLAGNVAGNIGMMLLPGAGLKSAGAAMNAPKVASLGELLMAPNTIRKGAAVGAGFGALQPTATDESALGQMAMGAAGGSLGAAIPNTISRMFSPKTRPEALALLNEGITPTPGQILGGAAHRLEDGATSIPFVGDTIKSAQRRAIDDFNRAGYNRALKPIGAQFDDSIPVGHEGLSSVSEMLSKAYDDVLPKLKVQQDPQFHAEIGSLRKLAENLPPVQAKQYEKILDDVVLRRFERGGGMRGETMQEANSKLGERIRRYSSSNDPDHLDLADALKETQSILKDLVVRNNPDTADYLKGINQGWANLVRLERAGSMTGAKEGVFSPAQLKNAARAEDKTIRHRGFAQGKALLQDLAESGQKTLGQTVPDSGTPFRVGAMAPLGATYLASPDAAIAALVTSGLYTRPGQSLAKWLLTDRSAGMKTAGKLIGKTTPMLSRTGAALIPQLMQKD